VLLFRRTYPKNNSATDDAMIASKTARGDFEKSHVPLALPKFLPHDWKGGFVLLMKDESRSVLALLNTRE
jgi:hypothetical protein